MRFCCFYQIHELEAQLESVKTELTQSQSTIADLEKALADAVEARNELEALQGEKPVSESETVKNARKRIDQLEAEVGMRSG
jgi:hypothetical protein